MAPEVFAGFKITFMSDIYSLGIIITEMLTGCKDIPKECKNNIFDSVKINKAACCKST